MKATIAIASWPLSYSYGSLLPSKLALLGFLSLNVKCHFFLRVGWWGLGKLDQLLLTKGFTIIEEKNVLPIFKWKKQNRGKVSTYFVDNSTKYYYYYKLHICP